MTTNTPSDSDQRLRASVAQARSFGLRVFGDGGIASQILDGEWSDKLTDSAAHDAAARWRALGEHVRAVRADPTHDQWDLQPRRGWLSGLPLNRKERYYTGTVFPGLIGSDGFAYLDRFLRLCGLTVDLDTRLDAFPDLLFCTEYGFAESVFTDVDRDRWGADLDADTPDIVISGPDWLVAVEAKMFHKPTRADLVAQMHRQAKLIERWSAVLGLESQRVAHVLLLPEKLARATAGHELPVITWERVLAEYANVGPRYWANVLATALSEYDALVSTGPAFGKNKDARLTGAEIVDRHAAGDLIYSSVGRSGGLVGAKFKSDVATGAWRAQSYEVRVEDPPNPNWFTVAEFIASTAQT